jgi:predicted enzyme related to lactoylglutathione lyase
MYFDTDDLEGILAQVASAGRIVKTERTPISPEMGWYGEFTDPSGVTIGLHTSVPAK